jgi:hypothetical protein
MQIVTVINFLRYWNCAGSLRSTTCPSLERLFFYPAKFQSEYAANRVWNLNAVVKPDEPSRGELVLLVFDEARTTLEVSVQGISQFRLIRRALWRYSQGLETRRPIFCVFVDTSSKIQNLAPQAALDSSLRPLQMYMEQTATELFRPYILRGSFDAFSQSCLQRPRLWRH